MPRFSSFTPLGMLRLSGAPSHAETIYQSFHGNFSAEFDMSVGSRKDAWSYANAMMLARVKCATRHAAGQALPSRIDVLLPPVERAYGLVPGPLDTVTDRRNAYATRRRIPKTPSKYEVDAALTTILGDVFLATVPTAVDDAELFPSTLGESPMLLLAPSVVRKVVRLLDPVFDLGGMSEPIRYESIIEDGDALEVGDQLIVEPETEGITEAVQVSEVDVDEDGVPTFVAAFEFPHSEGATAAQHPYPAWVSTKRHTLVVLTPAGASDATARRKVNEYLSRAMRASSTWSIVGGTGGETGLFMIGSSPIGAQTMLTVDYE